MKKTVLAASLLVLAGCASTPTGPGVMVLPGTGKSFEHFRFDDHECRQYASSQVNGESPNSASMDAGARSAAAGAVIGGLAGAALGGNGNALAAGAALGGAGGALVGTGTGAQSGRSLQYRYDAGYQQCMYAKGHKIPSASRYERPAYRPSSGHIQQRPATIPPPPPGTPPPPPPA
jgi:hypothetical protein